MAKAANNYGQMSTPKPGSQPGKGKPMMTPKPGKPGRGGPMATPKTKGK